MQFPVRHATIGTCHQLAFFNPGVAARFMFLDLLGCNKKEVIFMDTDRVVVEARIPGRAGPAESVPLFTGDHVLYSAPPMERAAVEEFFHALGAKIRVEVPENYEPVMRSVDRFRNILLSNLQGLTLREQLAESFVQFFGIPKSYTFLSDIIRGELFHDFFLGICRDWERFRNIYNEALDEYRREFRFRYRHYPFPKLGEGELPFWIVKDGKRFQFSMGVMSTDTIEKCRVLPKASPLTMFLRMHFTDVFIHGVGGANYEWINDRIIERFFHLEPPPYFVLSATFYIDAIPERNYPYFFLQPEVIRRAILSFMEGEEAGFLADELRRVSAETHEKGAC